MFDPQELADILRQVDDPAHKLVITQAEGDYVFKVAAQFGYPVKIAHLLPVLLIDDTGDLWMVDAVKAVRRAQQ